MENKIHFQVVTAGGTVFDKMVSYVGVPLVDGEAGILAGHAAMLGSLKEGVVKAVFENGEEYIAISGGVLSVANNELIMLARTAELAETIDLARAQASEKRARDRIEAKAGDIDMKRAELSLARALAREKAYSLIKK